MNHFETTTSPYSDEVLVYSSYDSGYEYTILYYHNGNQYIARKGELYINNELALSDETTLDKFLLEYARYFQRVIVCEDGFAEIYNNYNVEQTTIKLCNINEVKIEPFRRGAQYV